MLILRPFDLLLRSKTPWLSILAVKRVQPHPWESEECYGRHL